MSDVSALGFDELLRAQTPGELTTRVIAANWEVPAERKARNQKHMERWTLARFLLSPQMPELVRFPVVIIEGEMPDFMLASEGHLFGVEVSEITRGIDQRFAAVAEHKNVGCYLVPDPDDSTSPLRDDDIHKRLGDRDFTSSGWVGNSPEETFAELTCGVIRKKVDKAKAYHAADEHWLLLYANFAMPLSNASLHQTGVFQKIARCAEGARQTFRHVLIWKGHELLVF